MPSTGPSSTRASITAPAPLNSLGLKPLAIRSASPDLLKQVSAEYAGMILLLTPLKEEPVAYLVSGWLEPLDGVYATPAMDLLHKSEYLVVAIRPLHHHVKDDKGRELVTQAECPHRILQLVIRLPKQL